MSFPISIGSAKYSIVKISAIPEYCRSEIPEILDNYVFIFETSYSKDKDDNGFTKIDIVPINTLTCTINMLRPLQNLNMKVEN